MAMSKDSHNQLTPRELSTFCAQIAMVLKSGIAVSEGIFIMYEDMDDSPGRQILQQVHDALEMGEPLFQALDAAGVFPKYMVDMTQIGESTGKLEDVMDSLCTYYEREEAIGRTIKHAVTYPAIMVGMMLFVILVLIVEVLPIFEDVFVQLGSEMTGPGRTIMNLGAVIGRYSFVLVGVVAVLAVGIVLLRFTQRGQQLWQRWRGSFFLTKKISAKIASGRFAAAMSLMLASGLDTDESLEMVYKLVDQPQVRQKIDQCRSLMEQGSNFSEAVVGANIFAGLHARMLTVGYKTGAVDTVMEKLAQLYQEEIDSEIGNVISVLEPTLVAVMSIVVGLILLSVMFPLMGIMSTIG